MKARALLDRVLARLARDFFGLGRKTAGLARALDRTFPPAPSHPQNARFKDAHRGRRAFVIGNGPSLSKQDLSGLKGEVLFTMNAFDRHPLSRELSPTYHFLADPGVNTGTPEMEAMLSRVAEKMGDSQFFVPDWPSVDSAVLQRWRSEGRLWPVPMRGVLADEPVGLFDMTIGLPAVQTSAQFALMAAVYMGCNPIYLTGVDSDWAAAHDLDRHFYVEPTIDTPEPVDYLPYETILESTLNMWRGYRNLREYCRSRNVEIYNATAGGLLDVFPRKALEDVIEGG